MLVLTLSSCSADSDAVEPGTESDREPIRFSAQTLSQAETRAYVEKGPVTQGKFCLGYKNTASSNSFRVADVNFDNSALAGTGIGLVWTADGYKELSWAGVQSSPSTQTFYMDNVLKEYHAKWKSDHSVGENDAVIIFKNEHPFVAGLFDDENGTNDLLWGSKDVTRNTNPIVMDLHHYMAIVRVEITIDKTSYPEDNAIDLSTADISISNVVHKPYSFNRMDGSIALADNPVRETLVMVDTRSDENSKRIWSSVLLNEKEVTQDEEGKDVERTVDIYTTKDFVLPPQGLPEKENRPHLRIMTKDGRVFSGILPNAMWEVVDGELANPMSLYFLKEHKLTIRTRITQDPPELTFLPVTVRDWVCKDTHVVSGYQAGLYDAAGFYKLMSIYQKKYSDTALSSYGYIESLNPAKWVFSIYRTITLDYQKIKGGMVPNKEGKADFRFSITNRYKVYVIKNEDGKERKYAVSPEELYTIVTGGDWTPLPESEEVS